ncbi:hypothetical protein PoMZ_01953 [Pyricularia oryzae]|uniref:Uncharacterized protein n=1 Tax=Pyricularia oryzae TaxID=318829 RepID=A0A4P7NA53_PYROR|nr:hypothetical protein PoMZ_01953 [Pyricularia oryzae]
MFVGAGKLAGKYAVITTSLDASSIAVISTGGARLSISCRHFSHSLSADGPTPSHGQARKPRGRVAPHNHGQDTLGDGRGPRVGVPVAQAQEQD